MSFITKNTEINIIMSIFNTYNSSIDFACRSRNNTDRIIMNIVNKEYKDKFIQVDINAIEYLISILKELKSVQYKTALINKLLTFI